MSDPAGGDFPPLNRDSSQDLKPSHRAIPGVVASDFSEPYRCLTLRQHAVAILDTIGLPNRQIASMLGCSVGTVSTTKHAAWRVLGVTGRDHRSAALRTQRIAHERLLRL